VGRRLAVVLALALLAIPFAFPMWWTIASSFKDQIELTAWPPSLFPARLDPEHYARLLGDALFARQYVNSVYIGLANTIGTILIASIAGYAFARIRFPGATLLFVLLLTALLMPAEVTIIPLFVLMRELGWLGTHLPLLIEPMFGAQAVVGTFLMRQYFLSLPVELEDAGRIDGLGRFGIFRHIALPLAKPAIATLAILTFLGSWNAFLEPLIFLSGQRELATLPIALTGFDGPIAFAAATLSAVPTIVIFVIAQRYFIQGVASLGIKG
jgi:multiple sugar transport system permease protein